VRGAAADIPNASRCTTGQAPIVLTSTDPIRTAPGLPSFVTGRRTLPAGALEAFLRDGAGGSRGFWARGDHWIAHRGVLGVLDEARADGDRFDAVRSAVSEAGSTRFFGGFSFRDDHIPTSVWRAFGPALFHLPELELESRGGADLELRGRMALEPGQAEDEASRALEARLEDVAKRLMPQPGSHRARRCGARRHATERSAWERAVEEALSAIRSGRVSKVVLARTLDVTPDGPVDPVDVVLRLWDANRGAHVFLFEPEAGEALLGAAPETVATLWNGRFQATAVAGSIRRGEDPDEQAALAATLLASHKDREEQRIALDDMLERLRPLARDIEMDPEPHVLALPSIQHLETRIRARVNSGRDVLDLVRGLHPTPAVCGRPRDAALDLLAEEEPFERGWYAGPVGWVDGDGNGVFVPALRTGVLHEGSWRLFAGAGIVEGSVPALEWEETAIKFEPVLRALAASGVELEGGDVSSEEEAEARERR